MPDEVIEELWRVKDGIAREHGHDVRRLSALDRGGREDEGRRGA